MRIVNVPLGARSYEIKIAPGLLANLGVECSRLRLANRCAIITDSNVLPLFGKAAQQSLKKAGFEAALFAIGPGLRRANLGRSRVFYPLEISRAFVGVPFLCGDFEFNWAS